MATGFVDHLLPRGALACGAVHEWIGVDEPPDQQSHQPQTRLHAPAVGDSARHQRDPRDLPDLQRDSQRDRRASHSPGRSAERSCGWSPPLTLLVQIARQALAQPGRDPGRDRVIWIGSKVWPYAPSLAEHRQPQPHRLLNASLFIDARSVRERVWSADLALRSGCAAAVAADGSGLDLAATRRLQLAAEAGGALCLLARPPWEQHVLSTAATRWAVRYCPTRTTSRRWTVELLRCKGVQPTSQAIDRLWILERDHATRHVAVVPDVLDRSRAAAAEPTPVRRTG